MSKLSGYLSYKDWCILKHSLKSSIELKEKEYKERLKVNYSVTEKEEKELKDEKRTLERITKLVANYKTYINSKERHGFYNSVPFDCK